jgi:hypothetical protein
MKSPFPGMDPYLERHWRDVQHSLCTYASDALQPQVIPALVARIDERITVDPERANGAVNSPRGEQPAQGFVQILDRSREYAWVTVIEFLSLSDKLPREGQERYRRHLQELVGAGVNLVEIDLLRDGESLLQVQAGNTPPKKGTAYAVSTLRSWLPHKIEHYPIPLSERLPSIRIPLREQDKDATLNLQALIDLTYHNGAYDFIDYGKPPVPPLEAEAAAWADEVLRVARKR